MSHTTGILILKENSLASFSHLLFFLFELSNEDVFICKWCTYRCSLHIYCVCSKTVYFITTLSRRNRFMFSGKIARDLMNTTGTKVCLKTVRNRLRAARLKACRPYVGIPLTHRYRQERLQWVLGHRPWTRRQWNNVLFTDESRFNVSFADDRIRVWRRRGERLHADNVVQRDRYGGGSVMVWAGIYHDGKTELVTVPGNHNAQRYCDGILEPVALPFMQQHNVGIFQQDNARPHTARHTRVSYVETTCNFSPGLQDRLISHRLNTYGTI